MSLCFGEWIRVISEMSISGARKVPAFKLAVYEILGINMRFLILPLSENSLVEWVLDVENTLLQQGE